MNATFGKLLNLFGAHMQSWLGLEHDATDKQA